MSQNSVAKNGGLGGGALWDEDTFVISLEEGHYAAYIKSDGHYLLFCHLILNIYATRFTVYIFDANNKKITFCLPFENKYGTSQMLGGLYLQCHVFTSVCIYNEYLQTVFWTDFITSYVSLSLDH
ncbi:hypothetical protein ACJX0J_035686, partial [Zea mays]